MSEYREIRGSLQGERCKHKSWADLCEKCEIERLRRHQEAGRTVMSDEIDRLRAENERLTAENKSFRKVLTMIAEKHGQCGECGRDAAGNDGGVVDCVDERPDWYLYRSRCWWEPGDPARRARAALEGK